MSSLKLWSFCCYWFISLFHCGWLNCGMFQFSYICWDFLHVFVWNQFQTKFCELLRRICNLWCLGRIFCHTGPFDLWCCLKPLLLLIFCSYGVYFSISATLYLFLCLELNLKLYCSTDKYEVIFLLLNVLVWSLFCPILH